MSRTKDKTLKDLPPIRAGEYFTKDAPDALRLAVYGTTGEDLERLIYWIENANSEDAGTKEIAWSEFSKTLAQIEESLCALDADFFDRLARLISAVKAARQHDFAHNAIIVGLAAFYPEVALEAETRWKRHPYFSELIEKCSEWESWPKHGETEKLARKMTKMLKLKFAVKKPGPKGPRRVRR
jgi:hypothetical protein